MPASGRVSSKPGNCTSGPRQPPDCARVIRELGRVDVKAFGMFKAFGETVLCTFLLIEASLEHTYAKCVYRACRSTTHSKQAYQDAIGNGG